MKKPINHSGAAPSAHDDHLADALDYFRQGLSAEVWLNESVNIPFEEIAKASERVRRKFRKRGHFVFIGVDLAKPIRKEPPNEKDTDRPPKRQPRRKPCDVR